MTEAETSGTHNLREAISTVRERITQYRGKRLGEQNTKAALIDPILRALGWDTEDVDEVRREYRHTSKSNPADYALILLGQPKLFVEAKGLGEDLADEKWAAQVISYAATAGVPWVALTDGDGYRVYNALARVDIEGKLFRRVRLSVGTDDSEEALSHLSKEEIQADSLDVRWKAEQADRRVRDAVEEMFSPPADWVLRGLDRRLDGMGKSEIRAALSRLIVTLDSAPLGGRTPVERHSVPEPKASTHRPRADASPGGEISRATSRRRRGSSVSIADLISARLIQAPCTLTKTYSGRDLEATVENDGSIVFEGQRFDSPSMAAAAARFSVKGPPAKGQIWHTNGWIFWNVTNTEGRRVPIDDLRAQYLTAKAGREPLST